MKDGKNQANKNFGMSIETWEGRKLCPNKKFWIQTLYIEGISRFPVSLKQSKERRVTEREVTEITG